MKAEREILSIAILGMGYVGCVSAACLAYDGHTVTGVDVSEVKLRALAEGKSPIIEPGLDQMISEVVSMGRLKVTTDVEAAIAQSDLSLICVGTPSNGNGSINLQFIERVCEQVGAALAKRKSGHVVVIRSTLLPGTISAVVRPALEKSSGYRDGDHFSLAFNPEFLREGNAVSDYLNPPKIVIGTAQAKAADMIRALYAGLGAPVFTTSVEVAETVKYIDNAWHALKITFGNEVGEICRQAKVDSHDVMNIFIHDKHLNISPVYLKPGFAFGGSCLPKDLRALMYFARHHDIEVPVIERILASNLVQIERVFKRILESGVRRVGLYGLSFKPNTDDLRESPLVTLAERLIGKGIKVKIMDDNVRIANLLGANKEYVDQHLPHLMDLLVNNLNDFDDYAELVVIGHADERIADWARQRRNGVKVIDLARIQDFENVENYEGIYW